MRGVGDRLVVLGLELDVGLDDVDAGGREVVDRLRRLRRRVDAGAGWAARCSSRRALRVIHGPAIHMRGPGDRARLDPVADREALLERAAEVHGRRDAGHQELLRRDLRDLLEELVLLDPGIPAVVVAVAQDLEVGVQIDQPRQHRAAAACRRPRRPAESRSRPPGPTATIRLPSIRIAAWWSGRDVVAVEEHPADERELAAAPTPAPRRAIAATASPAAARRAAARRLISTPPSGRSRAR